MATKTGKKLVAKLAVGKNRNKRIPKLKFTKNRNIGWHVSYRDPVTNMPKKHRFKVSNRSEAEQEYQKWVGAWLIGTVHEEAEQKKLNLHVGGNEKEEDWVTGKLVQGSLGHITSGLLHFEQSRVREEGEAKRKGTITLGLCDERRRYAKEFMGFINSRYGHGAVGRMMLSELLVVDVEAYNRMLVEAGYSASQVGKRLRFVKAIMSRAGRPEFGSQHLPWDWSALDIAYGKPAKERKLPTVKQLKMFLKLCDVRETAIVWLGIGCGLGQRDISSIRIGQFDEKGYDLRRGKTGVDRYGETPKLVWNSITEYLQLVNRENKDRMFVTKKGMPVVHGKTDAIGKWWTRLREKLGEEGKDLDGFYILRHLGATEFGSRPGCSIGATKRWLGHSASSQIADTYMRSVSPENRKVVNWVRKALETGTVNLKIEKAKVGNRS